MIVSAAAITSGRAGSDRSAGEESRESVEQPGDLVVGGVGRETHSQGGGVVERHPKLSLVGVEEVRRSEHIRRQQEPVRVDRPLSVERRQQRRRPSRGPRVNGGAEVEQSLLGNLSQTLFVLVERREGGREPL